GVMNPAVRCARWVVPGSERVLCLNEAEGKLIWKYEYTCAYGVSYPAGPRTTPLVSEGKVYTLGAEGNLCCLEAESGKLVWSRDFIKDFEVKTAMWGVAGHPLLDDIRLICLAAGHGTTVVELDRYT